MDVQRYLATKRCRRAHRRLVIGCGKFLRRHKGPVAASAALAALLVLGPLLGTSIGLAWALRAEKLATDRLLEVTKEKERATNAETLAMEEAAIARAVNEFLQNDLLAEAAPEKNGAYQEGDRGRTPGACGRRIAGKFENQPRIEAAIRQTIGDTYWTMGDFPAAQPHLERCLAICRRVLGEKHPDTLFAVNNLAGLYVAQGQYALAEPLFVQTLDVRRRVLGEEHPNTLLSMSNLASATRNRDSTPKPSRSSSRRWKSAGVSWATSTRTPSISMTDLAFLYRSGPATPRRSRSSSRPWKSSAASLGRSTPTRSSR